MEMPIELGEVVTLEDFARFLYDHKLSMTMHSFHRRFTVTLTLNGRAMTGEGGTPDEALKAAWAQR